MVWKSECLLLQYTCTMSTAEVSERSIQAKGCKHDRDCVVKDTEKTQNKCFSFHVIFLLFGDIIIMFVSLQLVEKLTSIADECQSAQMKKLRDICEK